MRVIKNNQRQQSFVGRNYRVFLGYQFKSRYYKTKLLEQTVQEAVDDAKRILNRKYSGIELELKLRGRLGKPLNSEILRMVRHSAVTIFELSNKNMNVYFEFGLATAYQSSTPMLIINRQRNREKLVGSDVRDLIREPYSKGNIPRLKGVIRDHIVQEIKRIIQKKNQEDAWVNLRRLWGGDIKRERIIVVCGELTGTFKPKQANRKSHEHVNLSRYADQDALVETLKLLPKLFPDTEVEYYTSKELPHSKRRNNLIVIGGPDFNQLTKDLINNINLPFQYRIHGSETCFYDKQNRARFEIEKKRGQIIKDFGLFAHFSNPLNRNTSVIMIGGLQTFGVLGAIMAFAMNKNGKNNTKKILKQNQRGKNFVVLIPVKVLNAQPADSNIDMNSYRSLNLTR